MKEAWEGDINEVFQLLVGNDDTSNTKAEAPGQACHRLTSLPSTRNDDFCPELVSMTAITPLREPEVNSEIVCQFIKRVRGLGGG